jgi:NAD(P)-dependent dehydrogenase (short-subunit alcohol dehydrogenase family)
VRAANPRAVYCCDPVIGDVGRGVFVRPGIEELLRDVAVPAADLVTPNHFELDLLAGTRTASLPAVKDAVAAVQALGVRAAGVPADVGRAADRVRLVREAAEQLGGIDILVNNAAAKPSLGPLMDCPEETWDRIMEVNVKAYFELSRQVIPGMAARGWGRVINVSSSTGLKARRGMGEYAVSKAAEIMLTRSLAVELGQDGITVNALAPILTRTDFSERQWMNPAEVERVVGLQAIRRLAEPDDVAGAALLLASDAGRLITGQTIVVDGGALA